MPEQARPRVHVLHVPGADPQRDEIVQRLRDEADACVHLDPDREGCMATWLKCLACAYETDLDLPWSTILSDDADPLPGWQKHLPRAQQYSPAPALGLTHFGGYGMKALSRGVPYGLGSALVWGGAGTFHRTFLNGMAEWAPRIVARTGYKHDDRLIAAYALRSGLQTAMVARAIFGQPVKKSLLGHASGIRQPATTIDNCLGPDYAVKPRTVPMNQFNSLLAELRELAAR